MITPIENYLRDTPKSAKSIKTYLQALDKIFPAFIDRFRDDIDELKKFDKTELDNIIEVLSQIDNVNQKNQFKKELAKLDIPNKVFYEWRKQSPNKKADILMKWAKDTSKHNGSGKENTFLNYVWRIQGFLSKLGRDYEANPKNIVQLTSNGFHLEEKITFEEGTYQIINYDWELKPEAFQPYPTKTLVFAKSRGYSLILNIAVQKTGLVQRLYENEGIVWTVFESTASFRGVLVGRGSYKNTKNMPILKLLKISLNMSNLKDNLIGLKTKIPIYSVILNRKQYPTHLYIMSIKIN